MDNLLPKFRAAKQLEQRDRNIIIRSAYSTIEGKDATGGGQQDRQQKEADRFKIVQRQRATSHAPVDTSALYKALRLVAPSRRLPRREMMKLSPYSTDDPSPLSARSGPKTGLEGGTSSDRKRMEGAAASSRPGVRGRQRAGPQRGSEPAETKAGVVGANQRASTAPALGRKSSTPSIMSSFHPPSKSMKEVRSTLVKFNNLSTSGSGMDVFFLGYEVGGVNCSNLAPRETCTRRTRGVVKTKAGEEMKKRTSGVNIYTGIRVGHIPDFLKSTDDRTPITVKFSNNDTVCVYEVLWLDYSGHPMRWVVVLEADGGLVGFGLCHIISYHIVFSHLIFSLIPSHLVFSHRITFVSAPLN